MASTCTLAKKALWQRFHELNPSVSLDKNGYVAQPAANLIDPDWLRLIEADYRHGSGDELREKFCAVHSSAALAANHFARFKDRPQQLVLADLRGFTRLAFEQQLRTGLGGTPPNLDVFLESPDTAIAIESKLTETLSPKKPKFARSYQRDRFPAADDPWWEFIESAKERAPAGFLDVAQLVKHYLGLLCFLRSSPGVKKAILMYPYWKPGNADKFDEWREHERELNGFKNRVASQKIDFVPLSYPELWKAWSGDSALSDHAARLVRRYGVEI